MDPLGQKAKKLAQVKVLQQGDHQLQIFTNQIIK
tara:strand:- start:70 stop:171 length:102 start_codon:yes stop_codon:yes gene_type:complete